MPRPWRQRVVRYPNHGIPVVSFHVKDFSHSIMTELEMFGKAQRCRTFRDALEMVIKRGLGNFGMGGYGGYGGY